MLSNKYLSNNVIIQNYTICDPTVIIPSSDMHINLKTGCQIYTTVSIKTLISPNIHFSMSYILSMTDEVI